jgi:hypothetical protein
MTAAILIFGMILMLFYQQRVNEHRTLLTPPHKAGQDFNIAEKYDFSSNYLL